MILSRIHGAYLVLFSADGLEDNDEPLHVGTQSILHIKESLRAFINISQQKYTNHTIDPYISVLILISECV
jgi:hypothetical protein